jgi:hypothetical protein
MLAPPRPTAYPAINDTPCTQEALVKPTPLPPSGTSQRAAPWVGEGVEIIHAPCEHARRDTVMPASLLCCTLLDPVRRCRLVMSQQQFQSAGLTGVCYCMAITSNRNHPAQPHRTQRCYRPYSWRCRCIPNKGSRGPGAGRESRQPALVCSRSLGKACRRDGSKLT